LETNITVDSGATLSVTASGQVELAPQQPGTYICGPLGYGPRPGMGGGFPAKKAGAGFVKVYPGMLLGRIGENGNVFAIGDRYDAVPPGEGKLFLHINPSTYDSSSAGVYRVRITVKN